MKGLSFVFILLFLKAQASFLDDFRGAISYINNGVGKLLGDVVTDVKDTIYCTVSAVERVLVQNGILDKRTLYNQKCNGSEKPEEQPLNLQNANHSKTVSKIQKHSVVHHKHSSKRIISHESEVSIKNVNKTIIDILDNNHNNENLKSVPDTSKTETNHLAEISKIIRQESENISRNFKNEFRKLYPDDKSRVETILDEIQFLNDLRRNSTNDKEIAEIRRILDKVTNQMHLKINSQQLLNTPELEEINKELQKYSSSNGKLNSTTEKQTLQGTAQDMLSRKPKDSNTNTTIKHKDVALKISNKQDLNNKTGGNEHKQKQVGQSKGNLVKSDNSIFSLGLDSLTSFFKSKNEDKEVSPDDLMKNAKKIIADSQHSEKVLNNFFKRQKFNLDNR